MRELRNERVSAKFRAAHMYIREFSEGKLEVKLNGAISDVQFKPSIRRSAFSVFRSRAERDKALRTLTIGIPVCS